MLKVWNMILIILTYLLGIFGTFITRSGVVNSVHAFADSKLGNFFILYIAFVLLASLWLVSDRLSYLKSDRRLDSILSRESAFLFNNLVFVVACFAVLWGTMFPVLSQWIRKTQITVGPPFFNSINVPIGLLLLLLTGVGPLFAWHRTSFDSLKKAFFLPSIFAGITCVALLAGGMRNFYAVVCLTLCAFVLVTIVEEFYKGTKIRMESRGENFFAALMNLTLKNKRRYGGYIVHLSVVLIFVGLAGNAFNREAMQQLRTGQEMTIGDYTLRMAGFRQGETSNYQYSQVSLDVYKDGKLVRTLRPEQRIFNTSQKQTTTTVALYSTPKEDLYVVFAGMSEDALVCQIKAFVNPLVFWIWFGSAVMLVGAIICLLPDKRSRQSSVASRQPEMAALMEK
jgi:cytochrome c-type biogenesis protein CcmF